MIETDNELLRGMQRLLGPQLYAKTIAEYREQESAPVPHSRWHWPIRPRAAKTASVTQLQSSKRAKI